MSKAVQNLRRLRIAIIALTSAVCIVLVTQNIYTYAEFDIVVTESLNAISYALACVFILVSYIMSIRSSVSVSRWLRATGLFVVAACWFSFPMRTLIRYGSDLTCPSEMPTSIAVYCVMSVIEVVLDLIASLMVMIEVLVTLRYGPKLTTTSQPDLISSEQQQHPYSVIDIPVQESEKQQYQEQK
ncbi:hypothetical protein BGZ94_002658 [Podila epigama]|nr:hypothetical protein BGZ94_002658 [Podila epigama]